MTEEKPVDPLGDEIKELEAKFEHRVAEPGQFLMARADGRSFSTFTKGIKRPYDELLGAAMQFTTQKLCHTFNARLAYTQSDEITLVFYNEAPKDFPFGGRLQKLCSLIASAATVLFYSQVVKLMPHKAWELPIFDCRVFRALTIETVIDSFIWRERDARKNAVSMAASALYPHKELQKVPTVDRLRMIEAAGITFSDYPLHFKKGVYFHRQEREVMLDQETLAKIPEGKAPPEGKVIRRSVERAKFESLLDMDRPAQEKLFGCHENT
jgi:tRNA(His) guanylyltransferase